MGQRADECLAPVRHSGGILIDCIIKLASFSSGFICFDSYMPIGYVHWAYVRILNVHALLLFSLLQRSFFPFLEGHPPPDSISEKIVPKVISIGLFITMTTLASLGIVMTCLFLVFNIRYRHQRCVTQYINYNTSHMCIEFPST